MFNFGDGAAAALLVKAGANELLGSHGSPTARFAPGEGARGRKRAHGRRYPFLDVADPAAMKEQLDERACDNFVVPRRARSRARRSSSRTSRSSARCT
jgi:hypothetical protein